MNNPTDAEGSQEATYDADKPLIERSAGPLSAWVWPDSGRVDVFRDQRRDDWERPLTPAEAEAFGSELFVLAAAARTAAADPEPGAVPARRPSWLPGDCPRWCEASHEHSDRDHYDDRRHFGPGLEVVLTATDDRHATNDDAPSVARAYLSQHYREIGPRISLHRDDTPVDIAFTVEEAEEFARRLLDLVAEARRSK